MSNMKVTSSDPLCRMATVLFVTCLAGFSAHAQTDVAVSVYGGFTRTSEGNGTFQDPSAHVGGMGELRHIRNPLVGWDVNYSYNRANQAFNAVPVRATAHEIGAAWVVSVPVLMFRPFALAGGGVTYFRADSGQLGTSDQYKATLVYGAGLDWTVIPHLGLRFQYRGNVYKAPALLKAFSSTDKFTQTAEPMIGAYLRF